MKSTPPVVSAESGKPSLGLHHLAHELNSLLDGSMRSVSHALRAIERVDRAGEPLSGEEWSNTTHRLLMAREAMDQMAALLERAMKSASGGPEIETFDEQTPISTVVGRLISQLGPLALEHDIQVELDISPAVAPKPIGPLGPVLLNGLRNAIQAAAEGHASGHVALSIQPDEGCDGLHISVTDSGPGAKHDRSKSPGHHGIGLDVCRRIVGSLGGSLRLRDQPGGGAVLEIHIPDSSHLAGPSHGGFESTTG